MKTKILFFLIIFHKICLGFYQKDTLKVNLLNDSCYKLLYNNSDLVKKMAFESILLSEKLNYMKGKAKAFNVLGSSYDVNGNYDSALYYYQLSLGIQIKINNKKGQGAALSNIGLTYLNKNDYYNALNSFYKAIIPLDEIKHYLYLGNCHNNIGLLFYQLKSYAKSIVHFNAAIRYYDLEKISYQKANVYSNLANLYEEIGKKDSSIVFIQNAIVIYTSENDYYNLGKVYNNLGTIYYKNNEFEKSKTNLLVSLKYAELAKNYFGMCDTYHVLYLLYNHNKNVKEAHSFIQKSFELLPYISSPKLISDVYFHYARTNQENKNYVVAAKYFELSKQIKDSIYKAEIIEKIAITEAKYGLELKEKEKQKLEQSIKIQKLELQVKNDKVKKRNLLLMSSFILFVIILSGLIYYFNKRDKYQKIQAENKIKQAENLQRIKISNDLHDNVGAQLSYIVSNLDIMKNLNQNNHRFEAVADMSKQAILTLRETVWALNNESISIESFVDKFKQYCLKMSEFSKDIKLNFTENIHHEFTLNPLQALNLFRICQETFSNSLKHSKTSNIDIYFHNNVHNHFVFELTDKGIGFDSSIAHKMGHYGLLNMQKRAEEINSILSIESKLNEGTKSVLTLCS